MLSTYLALGSHNWSVEEPGFYTASLQGVVTTNTAIIPMTAMGLA